MASKLDQKMSGRVWKFGDSINTDIISPRSSLMPSMEQLKQETMTAVKPEFPQRVRPGDILVAGRNFGCGSHRETANDVLREVGLQAIVAESVARIFLRISVAIGFPIYVAPGVSGIAEDGDVLEIDYAAGVVRNPRSGAQVALSKYPPSMERMFDAGGMLPLLVQRYRQEVGEPE